MPRSVAVSVENNFTKGLVTEVTGVNSPENSVSESTNVVYDRRGRASPRKGFVYEDSNVFNNIVVDGARSEFLWQTVSGANGIDLAVVQFGSTVYFFLSGVSALSAGLKPFSINLLSYRAPGFSDLQIANQQCSFSSGKGYLFIAHPFMETLRVQYVQSSDSIVVTPITIQIRDFQGTTDTIGITIRGTTITNLHRYDLYNQGWYTTAKINGGSTPNVVDYWHQILGNYPSNADFWWYYTTVDTKGDTTGADNFDPSAQDGRTGLLGNTPAPKGHYILNALQTNRSGLFGISVPEDSSSGYRASVVAFFAGRAFYGGVNAPGFSSTIYFSQIIERDDQFPKCYQENDPTSKETSDLLDNDGGTIKIQDINTILDLRVIGQSLYVFASNGVWSLTGSNEGPFKATDYTVIKISSFPALSRQSIVDVGGLPIWWNYEGIFSLQKSQAGLTTDVTNLTQTTIQSFYDDIPQGSKLNCKGQYNDQTGLIYWLYNPGTPNATYYSSVLALDAVTGAFYPLTIPTTGNVITGLLPMRSAGNTVGLDNVVTNGSVLITTTGGSPVQVQISTGFGSQPKTFKFVTVNGTSMTFSEIKSETYLDFGSLEYDYDFITGYRVRGDLIKRFQTNYLTVVTEDVEDGSCYVQGLWDYSRDEQSYRFSNPQEVYRNRTFRSYQRSKLKMRGTGYSLQFKFFGTSGRPFVIVGWAGFETADQLP